jgi:hypothetical protein
VYRLDRAASLGRAGQTARAIAAVEEVTRDDRSRPEVFSHGALVLAVVAGVARDATAREKAATLALALLARARQGGLLRGPAAAKLLRTMPEWKPLLDRADFKKLLAEMDKETDQRPPKPTK